MNHITRFLLTTGAVFCLSAFAANFPDIGNSMKLTPEGFSQQVHDPEYSDLPAYLVEMKNGALLPEKLIVPAKTKFRIIVRNIGDRPAEFESHQLRQEKVLYMGTQSVVIVMPLDPGTYDYFDDFTPGTKGQIVAK